MNACIEMSDAVATQDTIALRKASNALRTCQTSLFGSLVSDDEGVQSFIMAEEATATTGSFYINYANIAAPGAAAHDYVGVVGFIEKDADQYILITNGQATINPAEGIEHININAPKAQKVLMDGVIYIVRDGKIFNLQGAQVR